MSAKLMGLVFELDISGDELPIMLALADHARDDGTSVYPSVGYLAWKINRSERSIQRSLRALEERGLIETVGYERGGRGRAREYVLHIEKGVKKSPYQPSKGRQSDTVSTPERVTDRHPIETVKGDVDGSKRVTSTTLKGDTHVTPTVREPLVNRVAAKTPRADRSDPVWDVCVELYGAVTNDIERGKLNAAVKALKQSGATPDEIRIRDRRMRQKWRHLSDFSANGLAGKWSTFADDEGETHDDIPDALLTNGWYRHGNG